MADDKQGIIHAASEGGVSGEHPEAQPFEFLVGPTTTDQFNTARLRLIPIACWRVDDMRFAFDSSFVNADPEPDNPNDIRSELKHLVDLVKAHPGAPLSVFGHADPVGSDDYNKLLSGRRAMTIYGLLIANGDSGTAVKLWQQVANTEHWGKNQRQIMEQVTGSNSGTPLNALIQSYLQKLCPPEVKLTKTDFLAQGADSDGKGDYQGCGEFNPLLIFSQEKQQEFDQAKQQNDTDGITDRNAENAPNRRVMVLMFRKGSKVDPSKWPCPRALDGVAGCKKRFWKGEPDGEKRRSTHLPGVDRKFEVKPDTFACRFYQRISDKSPCQVIPPPLVLTVDSLQASLDSTKNAASGARPAAGTFTTVNTSLDFAAPANDLMVVLLDAGEVVIRALNLQPLAKANFLRWQIDRDPTDTVAVGTPGLDTQSGAQVKLTPNTPGSFRLICYRDANGNGKHDNGEELRVLRIVIVRITPQPGGTLTTNSVFAGAVNGASTGAGNKMPMRLQADFLLEGGAADRRFGVDQVVLGNIGNLLDDTFVVNYPGRPKPNDTRNGTEAEDPDFQTNPAPGFPSPMVDSVNVAQGNEPNGGSLPFRGNSVPTVQGNGPGGNGQIRRVTSLDAPAFVWDGSHPTTNNPWATTQGANAFKEWITAFTNTFPRNYVALGTGNWTVNVIGKSTGGRWTDNGSSVVGTAWTSAGFPTTGDASGMQVLGRSFVSEFGMVVTP